MPSSPVPFLAVLGIVLLGGGVAAGTVHARQQAQEQQEQEELRAVQVATASAQTQRDLSAHWSAIGDPTRDGRRAAAALRILIAEIVTGETLAGGEVDDAMANVDKRLAELRDAADRLDSVADESIPDQVESLEAATADRLRDELELLGTQARATAAMLRGSAATANALAAAIHELHAAAADFVAGASGLPDSDDPDDIAAAWREELDRLEPYRDAAEDAAELDALVDLASAHLDLIDAVASSGETAIDHLEAGDVDAYNQHLEDELERTASIHEQLVEAMDVTLPRVAVTVETAEEHALGLLNEVERLRRSVPAQLALSRR